MICWSGCQLEGVSWLGKVVIIAAVPPTVYFSIPSIGWLHHGCSGICLIDSAYTMGLQLKNLTSYERYGLDHAWYT
jgi:hypothetical protein